MNSKLEIREMSIVVVANNHNPTILNPDFLKHNNIVPADWEIAKPPLCVEPMAEVAFTNNIKIIAQLEKIIFLEKIANNNTDKIKIPLVAKKYIETLPHVEYLSVGVNFKGHAVLNGTKDGPREFIVKRLLSPGPWRNFGDAPLRPSIKFGYTFGDVICNLSVEESSLRVSEDETIPVLLFGSNFHHNLKGNSRQERLQDLQEIIEGWKKDLEKYTSMVNNVFLCE